MSRCYPYPPPGYTPSRARKDALIESIKPQKEKPQAPINKEKKDERKDRKDERYEIREKTSEKTDPKSKKRRKRDEGREEKKRRRERNEKPDPNTKKLDFSNGRTGKNIWANREQLEGSGLTEEHDQPICMHLPSTSSESTENSSKRKRESSPVNVIRGHGNIIRIKLSSKKKNLADNSINEQRHCSTFGSTDIIPPLRSRQTNFCASTEKLCSTSGRTDIIPPLRSQQTNFCAPTEKTGAFVHGDIKRTDLKHHIISSSGKSKLTVLAEAGTPSVLDDNEASKQSPESKQYKNLIENWVPTLPLDAPSSPEDLDWLLCSKDQGQRRQRRQKFENDSVFNSSGSSLLQPRAQLLQEVGVYALPYTVPY